MCWVFQISHICFDQAMSFYQKLCSWNQKGKVTTYTERMFSGTNCSSGTTRPYPSCRSLVSYMIRMAIYWFPPRRKTENKYIYLGCKLFCKMQKNWEFTQFHKLNTSGFCNQFKFTKLVSCWRWGRKLMCVVVFFIIAFHQQINTSWYISIDYSTV